MRAVPPLLWASICGESLSFEEHASRTRLWRRVFGFGGRLWSLLFQFLCLGS